MESNAKSMLAKLLARENITIQHGNYDTAFFDVENRTLGLPLLKEMDKNVYDLLIGHEVGHALETPSDGWHNSSFDIPGCPRSFVNVVEDIRIEKLIQRRYPGLVHSFKKGYANLKDRDFFGVGNTDINTMSFMNRLNLKSKLRDLVDVQFTAEEMPYFKMAMAVETWDDVIAACRAIYEYLKEKQDNAKKQQEQENVQSNSGQSDSLGGSEKSNESEDPNNGENCEHDGTDPSDEDNSLDSNKNDGDSFEDSQLSNRPNDEKVGKSEEETGKEVNTTSAAQDALDVSTDDAFRANEESLLEKDKWGCTPLVLNAMSREQLNDITVSYEEIAEARKKLYKDIFDSETIPGSYKLFDMRNIEYNTEYKSFIDETTKIVNVMVKEFETRKAAFQYSRSKTSRSGSLNVNKLHEYKFNDDIFRKVTKLADAKSHGMVMVIDRSGSMRNIMNDVIRQTLTLAMFCKKVNIPFDVYMFTSLKDQNDITHTFKKGDFMHHHVKLMHILSSSFKKAEYNEAFRNLFCQTVGTPRVQHALMSGLERMGGTPLVEVLSAMPELLRQFKSRHGVQKVIMPLLTDGDASYIEYVTSHANESLSSTSYFHGRIVINCGGNNFIRTSERRMVADLLDNIRKMGVTTVGYFLAQSTSTFNAKVGNASKVWDKQAFREANKKVREQKFVSYDDTLGYDRYFILKILGNELSTDVDEFEIKQGARSSEITRAFKKYASAKKTNRIFATQFAEIIS